MRAIGAYLTAFEAWESLRNLSKSLSVRLLLGLGLGGGGGGGRNEPTTLARASCVPFCVRCGETRPLLDRRRRCTARRRDRTAARRPPRGDSGQKRRLPSGVLASECRARGAPATTSVRVYSSQETAPRFSFKSAAVAIPPLRPGHRRCLFRCGSTLARARSRRTAARCAAVAGDSSKAVWVIGARIGFSWTGSAVHEHGNANVRAAPEIRMAAGGRSPEPDGAARRAPIVEVIRPRDLRRRRGIRSSRRDRGPRLTVWG